MSTLVTATLIADLRAATRALHTQVEAAADIPGRLATPAGYAGLLGDLHGLHAGFEHALASVPGLESVRPHIDLDARRRSPLLAADLAALDVRVPPPTLLPGEAVPTDIAGALGCLYVLEGSARGGAVIGAMAVERFGASIPRRGLEGDDPAAGRTRWDALVVAVDAYGAQTGEVTRRRVIEAARATFRAFGSVLGASGVDR